MDAPILCSLHLQPEEKVCTFFRNDGDHLLDHMASQPRKTRERHSRSLQVSYDGPRLAYSGRKVTASFGNVTVTQGKKDGKGKGGGRWPTVCLSMYGITENIYYSQPSSVALLLQPEPVLISFSTRKGLGSLSSCDIALRSSPPSHMSTCNGQRSSQLFCVHYKKAGEEKGDTSISVVGAHGDPYTATILWSIVHHIIHPASSPVPQTILITEIHHNRLVSWNVYPSDEILIQLKPHIHIGCVRLFLFLYGTSHK
jgi:hypothetical protein